LLEAHVLGSCFEKNHFWLKHSRQIFPNFCKTKVLNVVHQFTGNRFFLHSTQKQAVATARMSSETSPVSQTVYDYLDGKYLVKRFRMSMRSLLESSIPGDFLGVYLCVMFSKVSATEVFYY